MKLHHWLYVPSKPKPRGIYSFNGGEPIELVNDK